MSDLFLYLFFFLFLSYFWADILAKSNLRDYLRTENNSNNNNNNKSNNNNVNHKTTKEKKDGVMIVKRGGEEGRKGGGVLLVTAHPDDEAMFFVPSILAWVAAGYEVNLLCLSKGDYDGIGDTRMVELQGACNSLGIQGLYLVDDPSLPDHPTVKWPSDVIINHLENAINYFQPKMIVSFDEDGASSHVNHIYTSFAVQKYANTFSSSISLELTFLKLQSHPTWRKYWAFSPIFFAKRGKEEGERGRRGEGEVHLNMEVGRVVEGMKKHFSQFVWFRRLFVVFSCYTYVNELVLM